MLESLYVKNLALIEKAEITFTEGLNVLSGETGAGKSVLIGSILIALGAKIPKDIIRSSEKEAYVELVFSAEDSLTEKLAALDITPEDGQVVISRKLTESKSSCRINGETSSVQRVREAAALLLDVYGQRDHQTLLKPENQLQVIDEWNPLTKEVKKEHRRLWERHRKLEEELASYGIDEDERIRRLDILDYEIRELEEADVKPDEEAKLLEEWKFISGRETLLGAYRAIGELLGYDSGACSLISEAQNKANEALELDSRAEGFLSSLLDAESILSDVAKEASAAAEEAEDDRRDPEEIAQRLDLVRHLLQKYRCSEEELNQKLFDKKQERETLLNLETRKESCKKEERKAFEELSASAAALTRLRKESAEALSEALVDALKELNFLDVRFKTSFISSEKIGSGGADQVSFLISTNPGEELKPLAQVASGGELSRIMLGLKSVLAEKAKTGTLVFDEIDAGISGVTAQKVGQRLKEIARYCQVICISHLAQIVSLADRHFLIEKDAEDEITTTHIRILNEEESILELGRLLSGDQITESVLKTARELRARS